MLSYPELLKLSVLKKLEINSNSKILTLKTKTSTLIVTQSCKNVQSNFMFGSFIHIKQIN